MHDPVAVAYRHLQPTAPGALPCSTSCCCRCGAHLEVTPLHRIVSAKFTGFDALGPGDGLCQSCAWSFSTPARRLCLLITATTATVLDSPSLYDQLLHPLASAAIVVPISGRKHVLPYAQWGTIRVDDINLTWRTRDTHRLHITAELRSRGVPATTLNDPAPPTRWLTTQPPETWEPTQRQWRELDPWRNTPHLDLALKATHHLKGNRS